MSKFWICDKCKQRIETGEQGRIRWWELIDFRNEGNYAKVSDFEILCMKCHAGTLNWRELDESIEAWHYLDQFETERWIKEFMYMLKNDSYTIASLKDFAIAFERVTMGDSEAAS